jgi:autotransporter-associated beta strand protein
MSHHIWTRWVARIFKQRRLAQRQQRRLGLELLEARITPTTDAWTGAVSSNWAVAGNWSNGVPVAGEDLVFGSVANKTVVDNSTPAGGYNSITFSAGGYTISTAAGFVLPLSGSMTVGANLGTETISATMRLTPSSQQAFTVNSGSSLDLSGNISGNSSAQTVYKFGQGTLELDGANSGYTGSFNLAANGGIVQITSATALGAGTTTVNANAQLQVGGGKNPIAAPIAEQLILNGPGIINDGAVLNVSGNNVWSGNVSLASDTTLGSNAGNLNFAGLISDQGSGHSLIKEGAGTITFSHLGGNTYRGSTTINNGILAIQDPLSLGAGANALDPQSGTPGSSVTVNYNTITGHAGTLELDLNLGAAAGQTNIPTTDPNAIVVGGKVVGFQVFNDQVTLNGAGFGGLGALYNLNGANGWDGNVVLGTTPGPGNAIDIGAATPLAGANTDLTISGQISDSNPVPATPPNLHKVQGGRLILSDKNLYNGNTFVDQGELQITDSSALGLATSAATVASGAALELAVDSGLDGTAKRTHNRNLGFDSVTNSGPGQEVDVSGVAGTFTLSLNGYTSGAITATSTTLAADIAAQLNGATGLLARAGYSGATATVTQDANICRVIFGGTLLNANAPLMTSTATGGATVVINPIYGLNVPNPVFLSGTGVANTGALHSISGLNIYSGQINLQGGAGGSAIGVDLDTRTGHPLADNTYLANDYSLTIPNANQINSNGFGNELIKDGAGQLIIAQSNAGSLKSATDIQSGWITVEANNALGAAIANPAVGASVQPDSITVESGASLHLLPPSGTNITLGNNLSLTGTGLASNPFDMLTEGAILSLGGNNTLTGQIDLPSAGTAGLGVDDPITSNPAAASTLTTTGLIHGLGGLTKLGSHQLTIQSEGAYDGAVNIQSGTLLAESDTALGLYTSGTAITGNETYFTTSTTVAPGAFLELGQTLATDNGGISRGIQVNDEQLVLGGGGQQIAVNGSGGTFTLSYTNPNTSVTKTTGPLSVTSPTLGTDIQNALNGLLNLGGYTVNGLSGSVTVSPVGGITPASNIYTVVFGGSLAGANNPLLTAAVSAAPGNAIVTVSGTNFPVEATADNLWNGGVSLDSNTILEVPQTARLTIDGVIDDAANPSKTGSTFTLNQVGTNDSGELVLGGANTYRGNTVVAQGLLTISNNQSLGGIGAPEIQTITVGSTGNFSVGFGANTTGSLPVGVTAATLQTDINNMPSVISAGGSVTVTRAGNVFTVNFGGGNFPGFPQQLLTSTGSATVKEIQQGYGGTTVASGAQLQMEGNLTVAGEPLQIQGTGLAPGSVPNIPFQWFSAGPSPINYGETSVTTAGTSNATTGRVESVAVDPTDPNVIYVATAGGGAWKTVDGGQTWTPLFDNTAAMFCGAIAIDPNNPNTIYLGTGVADDSSNSYYGSGVYVSQDGGQTWSLLTAPVYTPTLQAGVTNPFSGNAITKIIVDPNNPGVIYVASADQASTNLPASATGNAGIWRFDGTSWYNLTSIISPTRAQGAAYVTGLGFTPSGFPGAPVKPGPDDNFGNSFPTSGVYSDIQLGTTLVSSSNNVTVTQTAVPALFMALGSPDGTGDPNNAVYRLTFPATAKQGSTKSYWDMGDGNPLSISGGVTTEKYDTGGASVFPSGFDQNGTIRIAANQNYNPGGGRTQGATVYAVAANTDANGDSLRAIYRSTDGGQTWANYNPTFFDTSGFFVGAPYNYLGNQGNYDNAIVMGKSGQIYLGGEGSANNQYIVWSGQDGSGSFTDISLDGFNESPHIAAHSLAIDNSANSNLIVGTDGGVWSYNPGSLGSQSWYDINGNLTGSNISGVATAPGDSQAILAGMNNNGVAITSGSTLAWSQTANGNGNASVAYDPQNAAIAYYSQGGVLYKSTNANAATPSWSAISGFQGQNFPFAVDPVNPNRLLIGGNSLLESLDQGGSFSTNLGSPLAFITAIGTAVYQGTFTADQGFPGVTDQGANTYDPNTIYITDGSQGNRFFVTKDGGQTWVDRSSSIDSAANLGTGTSPPFIQSIVVDPNDRDHVFVVVQDRLDGANGVYESTDAGQSWTCLTTNDAFLTATPLSSLVLDPRSGVLYLGTDQGVYSASPSGVNTTWSLVGAGMPLVQVTSLYLDPSTNILTAGTDGRSVFQFNLDDPTANSGALRVLAGTSTWTGPILMQGSTTIEVDGTQLLPTGTASLNVQGVISGANDAITKTGQGTLVLSAKNTYGGITDVQAGVVVVNAYDALGSTAAGTTVESGAALQVQTGFDSEPITLNGDGYSFNGHYTGALRNTNGTNTYAGTITLNSNATIGVDSGTQFTDSGPITESNPSTLTKELTGTLVLNGAGSYSNGTNLPGTRVYQGTLQVGASNALGSSTVEVLDGAQIQLQSTSTPVTIGNALVISGTGINATGAIVNAGGSNAWNGSIDVMTLPGFAPFTTPAGDLSIGVPSGTLTLGGTVSEDAVLGTPTGLLKVGAGNLVLTQANTYQGSTEVAQGTMTVSNKSALGNRATLNTVQQIVTLDSDNPPQVDATFTVSYGGQSATFSYGTPASSVMTALNALSSVAGDIASVTATQIQTTNQNGAVLLGLDTGYLYTVVFADQTALPLLVSGAGGTTAEASFVAAGGIDTLVDSGATLAISSVSGISVDPHTLTLNGTGVGNEGALYNAAGTNTWNGPIELATSSAVGAAAATEVSIAANITGPASSSLTQVDPGTVAIESGASFTGATILTAGNLQADGTVGSIGGVSLSGGSVSGTGTVGYITSGAAGGTIDAGDNFPAESIGTLTTDSSSSGVASPIVTLTPADNVFVDIGLPASTNSDLLDVNNAGIALGGASLSGVVDPHIQIGDAYTIIQTDYNGGAKPADVVTGTFAGLTMTKPASAYAATITYIQGQKFEVDYYTDHVTITRELAAVTLTLAPTVSNPVYGQDEGFQATLTPEAGGGAPTGNVVFTVTGPSSSASYTVPIVSGVATLDVPNLPEPLALGSYTVTASYNGVNGSGFQTYVPTGTVAMTPASVTVGAAGTTTVLSGNPVTSVFGQSVTITATVSSQVTAVPGTLPPQGTVTFYNGNVSPSNVIGNQVLIPSTGTNSVATLNTTSLPVGTLDIIAVYNGDGSPPNYSTSTSAALIRTVNKDSTTTTVVPDNSNVVYGQPVTLTATVVANGLGGGFPSGQVAFQYGVVILGYGTLTPTGTNGKSVATYTTNVGQLPVGNDQITANYPGDNSFLLSSGSTMVKVAMDTTTTSLMSSAPTSVYGQPVTYTATVSANTPGTGNPSGYVTFKDGPTTLGTGNLNLVNGAMTATFTTSTPLPLGSPQTITAVYSGDPNYSTSTGTLLNQSVSQDTTTTTLTSSASASVYGQPVAFTATVSANIPGSGHPTGTVTFMDGASPLGAATLITTNGITTATFTTTSPLPLGAGQTITASYGGDTDFQTSSGTLSQSVNQDGTTTRISSSAPNGTVFGLPVTFTATVRANVPGSGLPSGMVVFTVGSTMLGSAPLTNVGGVMTATLTAGAGTVPALPVGANQTITATYSGDTDFASSFNSLLQSVGATNSSTSLASSGPAIYGQSVTFTATITALNGSGNPTGTVTFMDGSQTLGTANVSTAGGVTTAKYTTTGFQLPVGPSQTITAIYSGDSNYSPSSGSVTQSVGEANTTTTVAASSPAVYGQPVTLTATIAPPVGAPIDPTGTVTFTDGNITLAAGVVVSTTNGITTATVTTTAFQLPIGNGQTITAAYSGDTTYVGSVGSVAESVTAAPTTTTIQAGVSSAITGQPVTLTATVAAKAPGTGTPTGVVSFKDTTTNTVLASATLVNGTATAQVSFTTGGNNVVVAIFNGNVDYLTSTSKSVTVAVTRAGARTSKVTLASSLNPALLGENVKFTATVKDTGTGTPIAPTGQVFFFDGAALLGIGTLATTGGVTTASFSTSTLALGSHGVTAVYYGNATFAKSVSAVVNEVVNPVPVRSSTTTIASSANPSTYGNTVTFTATVTDAGNGAAQTPTGMVTFTDKTSGVVLGTAPLAAVTGSNGVAAASLPVSLLGVGTHKIVATYNGDAIFTAGNPVSLQETVDSVNSQTTVTSSAPNGSVFGQSVTFTATVAPVSGTGSPTGNVIFYLDGTAVSTVGLTLVNGALVATYTTKTLTAGSHDIVAVYSGDANVSGSTSADYFAAVNLDPTHATLAVSSTNSNLPISATATIAPTTPGAGTPTGTVSFYLDGTLKGTLNLVGGKATLNLGTISRGTHTIQIVYSGDANFQGSTQSATKSYQPGRGT